MYRISKRFTFSAAHSLPNLPPDHQCHRKHGHNYVVELILEGETLDEHGMVRDYGELKVFREWLDVTLEHRDLDEWMARIHAGQSTAEHLAYELFNIATGSLGIAQLAAVRVKETENTSAEYAP